MAQLWRSFSYAVPAFVLVVLLAAPLVGVVALRRRRSGAASSRSVRELALDTLTFLWLAGLALVTLDPGRVPVPQGSVELVPLRGILQLVAGPIWWQVPAAQIGGNVLLFVPGGVLMAWRRRWSLGRTVLTGAMVAIVIETAQYVLALGVASVDDVLLACVGTLIGAVPVRWARSRAARTRRRTPTVHSDAHPAPGASAWGVGARRDPRRVRG